MNRPPTSAARWMTCVGLYLAKMASVALRSLWSLCQRRFDWERTRADLRSPSFELRKIHCSSAVALP